jgi:hypothetical protein
MNLNEDVDLVIGAREDAVDAWRQLNNGVRIDFGHDDGLLGWCLAAGEDASRAVRR